MAQISLEELSALATNRYFSREKYIFLEGKQADSNGHFTMKEYIVYDEYSIIDNLIIHYRGDIEKINNCIIGFTNAEQHFFAGEVLYSPCYDKIRTYELILTDLEYAKIKEKCNGYPLHFKLPIDDILEEVPYYQRHKDIGWGGSEHRFFKGCGYEMHMFIGVNGLYLKLIDRENHDYTVADWEVELEEISMMTLQDLQSNINKTLKLQKIHDRKNVDSCNFIV